MRVNCRHRLLCDFLCDFSLRGGQVFLRRLIDGGIREIHSILHEHFHPDMMPNRLAFFVCWDNVCWNYMA